MRRSLAVVTLVLLVGCPGPPPDDGSGSGGSEGGEVPATAAELPWPDTPASEIARAETMAALDALQEPPRPVAFLVRMDVGYADESADDDAATRWVRLGFVLSASGLRVFDARAIEVTADAYGVPLHEQPLAPLARGVAELRLLEPDECEPLGDAAVCEPLLALAAEATEPAALVGTGRPTRLAPGDRALLGRSATGEPVVVDLTVEGAPRSTSIAANSSENPDP